MTGVFEIMEAAISLLGRFIAFDSYALPTKISQSSHTKDQRRNWSSNYSMTGPPALCAGMHTKISDICLGIFKQLR